MFIVEISHETISEWVWAIANVLDECNLAIWFGLSLDLFIYIVFLSTFNSIAYWLETSLSLLISLQLLPQYGAVKVVVKFVNVLQCFCSLCSFIVQNAILDFLCFPITTDCYFIFPWTLNISSICSPCSLSVTSIGLLKIGNVVARILLC